MALEGSLQDMSLTDLFQIFRTGIKSGVLILSSGHERGVIYVYQGRLIDAVLVCGPDRTIIATAEEAVLQLLRWDAASFTFRHDLTVAERPLRIVHDMEWLVIEGLKRRQNPLRTLPHEQITLDSRLELAAMPNSAESGVNLDLDQWRVLSQIAVSESVREIAQRTGTQTDATIRIVMDLVAIGLVEIVPPPRPNKPLAVSRRQQINDLVLVPSLTPAYANTYESPQAASSPENASTRGLLGAIMRRIRGL